MWHSFLYLKIVILVFNSCIYIYFCCCCCYCCCCCSVAKSWPTLCNPMHCSMPGSSVLYQLLEFAQIHVHWVNDAIQLSHPLLPTFPVSFTTSQLGVFSNNLAVCIRWPKYWSFSFSFSISPSNEYLGLISSRMDWVDLLAVHGTLKSLLPHHTSKTAILWHSAFFVVQLSHLYMIIGKTIALTIWTFVRKVMCVILRKLC